ncbi:MAG: hypothetical protein AAF677_09935 [Pseudomonadota bacterium]
MRRRAPRSLLSRALTPLTLGPRALEPLPLVPRPLVPRPLMPRVPRCAVPGARRGDLCAPAARLPAEAVPDTTPWTERHDPVPHSARPGTENAGRDALGDCGPVVRAAPAQAHAAQAHAAKAHAVLARAVLGRPVLDAAREHRLYAHIIRRYLSESRNGVR